MQPDEPVARLLAALNQWDEFALASVLKPDIRLVVDSGDESGAELRGRARVIRGLRERLASHPDASLQTVHVNGRPGLVLRRDDGEVIGVLSIDGTTAIETLWLSTAPPKLTAWNPGRPEID